MSVFDVLLKSFRVAVCTLGLMAGVTHGQAQKPNILIILADDLGWGDVDFTAAKSKRLSLTGFRGKAFC